jgi:hypothetical protein
VLPHTGRLMACVAVSGMLTLPRHAIEGQSNCTGSLAPFGAARQNAPAMFADALQLADWRGGMVAVGDPALEMRGDSIADARLVAAAAWDAHGSREILLPPSGAAPALYPRVASTSDGVLHVLYGTVSDFAHRNAFTRPDTIWHVEYSTRGWSLPTPFSSIAPGLVWWEHLSSSNLLTYGATLDIALALRSRDSVTVLLLHRDASGQWQRRPIVTGGDLVLDARLARLGQTLVLSYAAPDPSAVGGDRGSVFVMRSRDEGRTWSRPVRVFAAGQRDTYDHTLLSDSSGTLFLVWRQQNAAGARLSDTIAVSRSVDSGATWRQRPSLAVPEGFTRLESALSARGVLVMFASIRSGPQAALLVGDEWKSVSVEPALADISGIALHRLRDGSIALVGTRSVRDGSPASRPAIPSTDAYRLAIACGP